MITDMRDSISSWPVRIVLILLILSFISFYGLRSSGSSLKMSEAAVVNGESIPARDFAIRYQNLVRNYQKQGQLPEEIPAGIDNLLKGQLLNSMIQQKLKSSEAKVIGLVPSNEKTKETIKKSFSSEDGKFNFEFYKGYLRNQLGKTTGQFEEEIRDDLRADMYEKFMRDTGIASNLQLKQNYEQTNQKVSLSFVKLNLKNTASIRPKAKPLSTDELKKYYEEHKETFKTPEKKKLDIAFIEKTSLGSSKNFPKEAQSLLQEASSKYKNIADAVAQDARLRHITTGLVGYGDAVPSLTSTELTEVLNSTQNLEVEKSSVLVSRDGNKAFLIKLMEIKASTFPEFASVQEQVAKSYAQSTEAASFEIWIQSAWDEAIKNQSLESIAKKTGSPLKNTEAFSYSSTNAVPELGTNQEIMSQAFTLSNDKPYFAKPIKIGEDYVFIKLKSKEEPDWKKFETDQDTLAGALQQQNSQSRLMAWMDFVQKKSVIKRQLGQPEAQPAQE